MLKKYLFIFLVFSSVNGLAQFGNLAQDLNNFVNDATLYSDRFITPATDAAIYQASSSWMTTPKKKELFSFTLGVQGNLFVVPNRDRSFRINSDEFSFFELPNNQNYVEVPTALGGDVDLSFTGDLGGFPLSLEAPKGIDQETVFYPYIHGSIALWNGFEVVGRYSTKVKLKKGDYQVYGIGLKHNFSQYMDFLNDKNIHLAAMLVHSKENINFSFIDKYVGTFGNIGVSKITGNVSSWQFQISASKQWNKFELMASTITNISDIEYYFSGEKGQIEQIIPVQQILNDNISKLYNKKYNSIGEISGRYQISNFYIQSSIAFGKFVNANAGIQYEFN